MCNTLVYTKVQSYIFPIKTSYEITHTTKKLELKVLPGATPRV
jgi:hypothetical protein